MQVKGSALRARSDYVQEMGDEAYRSWFASLSQRTRELVEAGFMPNDWYPFEVFVELCERIDDMFGHGDRSLCRQLGYYACDKNLPTLYRLLFKVGNIGYIITRAQVAWRVTYDTGQIHIAERNTNSVVLEIHDWPDPRRAHCLSVLGWMIRAGEISGASNLQWQESCRAAGDDICRFSLQWD